MLLVYVLPKFSALFTDMGHALPLQARLVLGLLQAIRSYWWVFGGAVASATPRLAHSPATKYDGEN